MDRKKVLIIFGVTVLLGISLILFMIFSSPDNPEPQSVNEKPPVSEEKPEPTTSDEEEEVPTESAFVKEDKLAESYMDGSREKAEVKKTDYSYLLASEPIEFQPNIPPEWEGHITQIDEIPDFFSKTPAERAAYYQVKTDFTDTEKVEVEKIKELNNAMYQAYGKGDYNTFLSHMYKGWREYYGVFIGKMIKGGEYKERILGFYPEFVDTKIGFAYGFMVREVGYIYNGSVVERRVVDSTVMYKQNDKSEWELYFEYQME